MSPPGVRDTPGRPSLFGEDDALDTSPNSLVGNGVDMLVQLFQVMVIGDKY